VRLSPALRLARRALVLRLRRQGGRQLGVPALAQGEQRAGRGQGGQPVLVLTWDEMEIWGGVRACAGDVGPLTASTIRNRAQVKLGYGFQHICIYKKGGG